MQEGRSWERGWQELVKNLAGYEEVVGEGRGGEERPGRRQGLGWWWGGAVHLARMSTLCPLVGTVRVLKGSYFGI